MIKDKENPVRPPPPVWAFALAGALGGAAVYYFTGRMSPWGRTWRR